MSDFVAESPCAPWITGDDVAGPGAGGGPTPASSGQDPRLAEVVLPDGLTFNNVAQMATDLLYHRTGERWGGTRSAVIRPTRLTESCHLGGPLWGAAGWGLADSSTFGWFSRWFPEGWGCGYYSASLWLDGPHTNVTAVEVHNPPDADGDLTSPGDWQLFGRRLVRMADPLTNTPRAWPCCQRLDLALGQPGTWAVSYSYGQPPPWGGVAAVRDLAVELAVAIGSTKQSRLPQRVTQVARQGVTVQVANATYLKDGYLGLPLVDAWVDSVNPAKLRRRPRVYTPDDVIPVRQAGT